MELLLQSIFAVVTFVVTYLAAIRGAERGARLSQLATIDREQREIEAIQLLLALEIRQNLIDLRWLRSEMAKLLGDETEADSQQAAGRDPDRHTWLEARRRFIALYMPDWSHRGWYGQQSSYLMPRALGPTELRKVSRHHSQLDRLTQIKNMLNERAMRSGANGDGGAGDGAAGLAPFDEEAALLWREFVAVSDHLLGEIGNPLRSSLDNVGVQPFPAPTALSDPPTPDTARLGAGAASTRESPARAGEADRT